MYIAGRRKTWRNLDGGVVLDPGRDRASLFNATRRPQDPEVPGTQPGPDVNWFGALSKKISLRQNPNQFLNRFRVTSVVQVRATSPASVGLEGEEEERSWRIGWKGARSLVVNRKTSQTSRRTDNRETELDLLTDTREVSKKRKLSQWVSGAASPRLMWRRTRRTLFRTDKWYCSSWKGNGKTDGFCWTKIQTCPLGVTLSKRVDYRIHFVGKGSSSSRHG